MAEIKIIKDKSGIQSMLSPSFLALFAENQIHSKKANAKRNP
jgi:hypothetical protein